MVLRIYLSWTFTFLLMDGESSKDILGTCWLLVCSRVDGCNGKIEHRGTRFWRHVPYLSFSSGPNNFASQIGLTYLMNSRQITISLILRSGLLPWAETTLLASREDEDLLWMKSAGDHP